MREYLVEVVITDKDWNEIGCKVRLRARDMIEVMETLTALYAVPPYNGFRLLREVKDDQ